jgi:tetratricopeptide (TPR) repeat protein
MGKSMRRSIKDTLAENGGRLDPAAVDGAAGEHLQNAVGIFRGHLEAILVPDPVSPITRTTPPSRVSQFEFVSKWDVNAWAILAEERPLILFHAGIPFALFELFNALLARDDVLPRILEGNGRGAMPFVSPRRDYEAVALGRWPSVVPLSGAGRNRLEESGYRVAEGAGRHVTWSHYLPSVPGSDVREMAARQLYLTAVHFLFCHELGHIDLGHLEYVGRRNKNKSFSLSEVLSSGAGPGAAMAFGDITSQALEVDADRYALATTLTPYLRRKGAKRKTYMEPRFGDTEPGSAASYHMLLFSLGALMLFLEYQRKKHRSWLSRFIDAEPATHPNIYIRIRSILTTAEFIAQKSSDSPESMQQACREVIADLQAAATLLGLDPDPLSESNAAALLAALLNVPLDRLKTELDECRAAVAERYYLNGQEVSATDFRAQADPKDLYMLSRQSVIFDPKGENIEIPFLHESDPVEIFLENSAKWEKVGLMDNALVYAILARTRAPDSEEARDRIRELRQKLAPHIELLVELIRQHGLASHLADKLADRLDAKGSERPAVGLLEELHALLALRPREARPWLRLANYMFRHKNYDGAGASFEKASTLAIGSEEHLCALVGVGNSYAELGRTDDAIAKFRLALDEEPGYAPASLNLGICLVRAGRHAEAVPIFEGLIESNPTNAEAWFLSAAAHRGLRDHSQVRSRTEKAVELGSGVARYRLALAQVHLESQEYRRAAEELTAALSLGADRADVLYTRAITFLKAGERQAARDDFAALAGMSSRYSEVAARALEELGHDPS